MNGTDFRNEYKNAMEELTPSSELLKLISGRMDQAAAEPIQLPLQNKSFLSRHRAILTAAATLVMVIGICAVGAVVVSHFNNMNDMTGSASFDGAGAASMADAAEEIVYPEKENGINDADNSFGFDLNSPTAVPAEAAVGEYESSNSMSADGYYSDVSFSDDFLQELAEKAKNGALTIEDMGKNITIQGDDSYCQVFRSFVRDTVSYTLIADFKDTDGELKVKSLYITETEQKSVYGQIDLINNSDFLEEYFAGRFSEKIN